MLNIYRCQNCGGGTVTINRAAGTTPFSITCSCCGVSLGAISSFYDVPQIGLSPTHEFFRPASEEELREQTRIDIAAVGGESVVDFETALELNRQHVAQGGLLLRKNQNDEVKL